MKNPVQFAGPVYADPGRAVVRDAEGEILLNVHYYKDRPAGDVADTVAYALNELARVEKKPAVINELRAALELAYMELKVLSWPDSEYDRCTRATVLTEAMSALRLAGVEFDACDDIDTSDELKIGMAIHEQAQIDAEDARHDKDVRILNPVMTQDAKDIRIAELAAALENVLPYAQADILSMGSEFSDSEIDTAMNLYAAAAAVLKGAVPVKRNRVVVTSSDKLRAYGPFTKADAIDFAAHADGSSVRVLKLKKAK